jgi:hypothetical protein
MTKKLADLFDLPDTDNIPSVTPNEALQTIAENREIIEQVNDAIDKIDTALPTVRDLSATDQELDDLANLAKDKFQDLMDLGMNMDPRFAGVVLQSASTLLGHAITAKTAKIDKKLKMVQLQLQKARLDHQISKDSPEGKPIEGQGIVLDRNALLDQILQKNKNA